MSDPEQVTLDERQMLHALSIPPMSLDAFCEWSGKHPETVMRWEEQGLIRTENIHGRRYVATEEIMRFNLRVRNGEFSKTIKSLPPPRRPRCRRN